jgi:putative transposase
MSATSQPNAEFVTQQARNLFAWGLDQRNEPIRFLIRDHDCKYILSFDEVFGSEGAQVILTPIRAPTVNAFAERVVKTVRSEILDWTLIVSRKHLDGVLRTYVSHYNAERPHRGLELAVPDKPCTVAPVDEVPAIGRRDFFGELVLVLHRYSR